MYELEATADLLVMTGEGTSGKATLMSVQPALDDRQTNDESRSREAVLVDAVLAGHHDRFGDLYELYAPLVHGVLLARMPRSEVEDTVQEIFLHALRKLHTLRDANAFGPWIAMIARNRAMDFHRRNRETVSVDETIHELRSPENKESQAEEILAIIRTLPDAYRETLVLRLVEGMTGPEIARRTGLTAPSVRVNLHRGMKLLREKLGVQEAL